MDGKLGKQTEKTHPEDHNTRIVERNRKRKRREKMNKTPRDTYVIKRKTR
jgi:hypothetical protein